jgi:hypothetical protein
MQTYTSYIYSRPDSNYQNQKNFLNEQKFQLKSVILNNIEGRKKSSCDLKN